MKRFTIFLALVFLSVPLAISLAEAPVYTPAALQLEKECVIIGRIQGADVMLYRMGQKAKEGQQIPSMARIKGFEILNTTSGDWQPLTLSEDGYFCVNVGMGKYDLRGRDCQGRPYLIHRFNVPMSMAVNLGTFWVDACDPSEVSMDLWHNYERTSAWREYRDGEGHIAVRLVHDTSPEAYTDCETWFAGCHEEIYEHFEEVMARR